LRKDIIKILKSLLSLNFASSEAKLGFYVLCGTVPVAVIGLLFKSFFESLFSVLPAVGIALMINGAIIFFTQFFKTKRKINFLDSLFIGIAQAFSIIPGISRSGSTISMAIFRGVDRKTAYKFSFLLSILAILGASLIEFGEINFAQESMETIALGIAVSAFIGYFALKTVANTVLTGDFHKFAYYCWLVGIAVLFLSL
jgi:undecaprenyl-diphosphatase